jgi:dihydrofolate reductase
VTERHLIQPLDCGDSLLEAGLVDTVEIALIPVLLGGGIPMLPPPSQKVKLELTSSKALSTGIVMLTYKVAH